MPIEGPIVDLSSLNENWPLDDEIQRDAAPPHMRLTKDAYKKAFTGLASGGGVVNASAAELNYLTGIQGNVQTLIDEDDVDPRVITGDEPASANDKLLCVPPVNNLTITLPLTPPDGTEVLVQDVLGLAASPDNRVIILAQDPDTITNLTTGATDLTSIPLVSNSQYRAFVYSRGVWNVWSLGQDNLS